MKDLLELAAKIAQGGQDRNFRLGAVAKTRDGILVGATNGTVNLSSNCSEPVRHPSAHAEARVLRKAGRGSSLWVVRLVSTGMTMAKPCPHCQALIKSYGVERVVYSVGPDDYDIWYPKKSSEPKEYRKQSFSNSTVWAEVN